jgi:hypothetical protein
MSAVLIARAPLRSHFREALQRALAAGYVTLSPLRQCRRYHRAPVWPQPLLTVAKAGTIAYRALLVANGDQNCLKKAAMASGPKLGISWLPLNRHQVTS